MNPINDDDKWFRYAVTTALNVKNCTKFANNFKS